MKTVVERITKHWNVRISFESTRTRGQNRFGKILHFEITFYGHVFFLIRIFT